MGYEPQEDTSFDAYTLGQAHPRHESKRAPRTSLLPDDGVVDRGNDHSVSFGLGPSTRYLKQRWSDGTPCDKTGRPREIEVQVHCSMTTSDFIYMVKEMAICQYVMIIHSPHLCSLPGFKAENIEVEAAGIRCREIVSDEDWEKWRQGGTESLPLRLPLPKPSVEPVIIPTEQRALIVQDNGLKGLLEKALEVFGQKAMDNGGKDDVVLLSWEEGEDGAVLLDADLVISGDGESKEKLGQDEKELIMKVVREYLELKDDEEKNGKKEARPRDEL